MHKILMVTNFRDAHTELQSVLIENGFSLRTVPDAATAVHVLDEFPADLIIADLMMDAGEGIHAADRLIEEIIHLAIPSLFVMPERDLCAVKERMSSKLICCIAQPYTIEEICREIVFHLSRMEMMRMDGIITALGQNVLEQMRDEVRIPCEAIINYTKTIFSGAGAIRREDFEEMTQYIQSAELHVKNKTDKFLTLMDLIAAEISKELSSLAPTMKLNERLLVSVIDRQIAHKELQTTVNALIQPATLLIHEYYFSLLIRELIENAARFSKPDTIVHIIGGIHDNMYRLSVHDTGIGMSRNEIAHIGKVGEFNYTNLEGSENGLGLAIVMKILELCKGDIFIKSKKGFYTTVTLCLPLANPA